MGGGEGAEVPPPILETSLCFQISESQEAVVPGEEQGPKSLGGKSSGAGWEKHLGELQYPSFQTRL